MIMIIKKGWHKAKATWNQVYFLKGNKKHKEEALEVKF